mgnify:CR=1 FL=1
MFENDCRMIIMACNTASASALRRLQQTYLVENYPERRILGVVVPTIEYALDKGYERLGLIGTNYTVSTNVYEEELKKINPKIEIFQQKTPRPSQTGAGARKLLPVFTYNNTRFDRQFHRG